MSHLFHKIGYSLRHWSEVGITMQRKLTVYFACTVLVVFVAAVVLIQTAGIMPGSERDLGETLTVQHQNTVSAMTKQMDLLTARSISLSEEITWTMEQILIEQGKTFADVNDNPQLILNLEDSLYGSIGNGFTFQCMQRSIFYPGCHGEYRGRVCRYVTNGVYLRFPSESRSDSQSAYGIFPGSGRYRQKKTDSDA